MTRPEHGVTNFVCSGSRSVSISTSVVPSRLVSGVLISWLTLARKCDLASLASSAARWVRFSSRSSCLRR